MNGTHRRCKARKSSDRSDEWSKEKIIRYHDRTLNLALDNGKVDLLRIQMTNNVSINDPNLLSNKIRTTSWIILISHCWAFCPTTS
jgi:hypothetical protein